jgi:GNAT superfamily N-acetyltransferase
MNVTLESESKTEDVQRVRDGLDSYNVGKVGVHEYQALNIFIRNDDDQIVGGLLGGTYWNWCHVDILWLDESIRRDGYGSKLLQMAEEEAVKRGCLAIFLDTMSFQAPEFYKKHGYTLWGQLDDFPVGNQRFFLQKRLV